MSQFAKQHGERRLRALGTTFAESFATHTINFTTPRKHADNGMYI